MGPRSAGQSSGLGPAGQAILLGMGLQERAGLRHGRPAGQAGDGTRTRDPLLGRQMLCHLSYSRARFIISSAGADVNPGGSGLSAISHQRSAIGRGAAVGTEGAEKVS